MGYLKFISYLYLAVAALFVYDGIMKLKADENSVISFGIAGVAVFMFFFRRWSQKKMENSRKNNQQ